VPILRAEWVLPVAAPPISQGWVEVQDGAIVGVGGGPRLHAVDLGAVAILPSLVNAHTHLELSYLRGVIPRATQFLDWIRAVMAARRTYADPADPAILFGAYHGISGSRAAGTGLVGDISNTLVTIPLLQRTGLPARVFHELLGFNVPEPESKVSAARQALDAALSKAPLVRGSLAPHAPYSVSPALLGSIRLDLNAHPADVASIHLAESRDEVQFLQSGRGGWKELLAELGVWTELWRTPRLSPLRYLEASGYLDPRVLIVHGVQFGRDDLERVKAAGATLVSCPRSNQYVGVGDPPLADFYASGARVAFGTDSLASVEDLSVFGELAAARRLAPGVPASRLLESATLTGAHALGFGDQFGSIQPGKRASLIAVRLPAVVDDVEEYLLTGIQPRDITWLDS
jgi:cytosine/adenosine deaminase-related metal-dependent hydrolase